MVAGLIAGVCAFFVTLIAGYPFLAVLRRAGVAKLVRADELATHLVKTGTLTMGELLFTVTMLMGWTQTQVAQRFWLVSMILGLLGAALALA